MKKQLSISNVVKNNVRTYTHDKDERGQTTLVDTVKIRKGHNPHKKKLAKHNKEYCRMALIGNRRLYGSQYGTFTESKGKVRSELRLIALAKRKGNEALLKQFMKSSRFICWSFCNYSGSNELECGNYKPHSFRAFSQYNLYW